MTQKQSLDVELYGKLGTGRTHPHPCTPTTTYKGRIKNSIDFIAAKSIDLNRKEEVYNYFNSISILHHPNIVKFFGWYQTDHHFWFILEYCPGGTLLELLEQDIRLPESIIRIFAADILDALFYIHCQGLIIRDLQPRNILLDECGNLKISDFSKTENLKKPNSLGTPDRDMIEYMAPELFSESGVASFSSDFWSLGCLLYRMASGSTPFHGQSTEETVQKIHNMKQPPLTGYSEDFNNLVEKLLSKEYFARPSWTDLVSSTF